MKSITNKDKRFIRSFLNMKESVELILSLEKVKSFHDDPNFYYHHAILSYHQKYSDGPPPPHPSIIHAGGVSFISTWESLLKCLVESAERFSLFCYRREEMIFSSFTSLNENALDPMFYIKEKSIRKKRFGWVKGYNLTQNTRSFIPAKLVYVNYFKDIREPFLTVPISTGAAGGFDHLSTLLRSIYEVTERDAFITVYLTKVSPPRIDLFKIKNKQITDIAYKCKQYNLELNVFDISNDLNIPTYLSILTDSTGYGPAISAGAKSHLDVNKAITGSISESFLGRLLIRKLTLDQKFSFREINPSSISTLEDRGLYWSSLNRLSDLNYLFRPNNYISQSPSFYNPRKQLEIIKTRLKTKGFNIYYKDITLDIFRKLGLLIYKVIIPGLQPLYINESKKEIKLERLASVSKFYGQKKLSINKIPHPFL